MMMYNFPVPCPVHFPLPIPTPVMLPINPDFMEEVMKAIEESKKDFASQESKESKEAAQDPGTVVDSPAVANDPDQERCGVLDGGVDSTSTDRDAVDFEDSVPLTNILMTSLTPTRKRFMSNTEQPSSLPKRIKQDVAQRRSSD